MPHHALYMIEMNNIVREKQNNNYLFINHELKEPFLEHRSMSPTTSGVNKYNYGCLGGILNLHPLSNGIDNHEYIFGQNRSVHCTTKVRWNEYSSSQIITINPHAGQPSQTSDGVQHVRPGTGPNMLAGGTTTRKSGTREGVLPLAVRSHGSDLLNDKIEVIGRLRNGNLKVGRRNVNWKLWDGSVDDGWDCRMEVGTYVRVVLFLPGSPAWT